MAVPGAPAAPVLINADANALSVRWAPPSSDGGAAITSYQVQFRTSRLAGPPVVPAGNWQGLTGIEPDQIGSYRISNLRGLTSYDVQVRAVNSDGDGAWSASLVTSTLEPDTMTQLNADLTKVQCSIEASAGVFLAATRMVPFLTGRFRPIHEFSNLDEMRGLMGDYEDVLVGQACELELTQALDYENILPAFLCGFQNANAVGNAPAVYTMTPGRTAPVALDTASWEIAQTDGSSDHFRRSFAYARPTAIGIELAEGVAQLRTTWMGRAAQALSSPANVAAVPRTPIPARQFEVWIDDTWARLGTTKIGTLRTASIAYNPGLAPAHNKAGRTDFDLTDWYRSRFQGSLSLTVDHDGDMSAELEHHFDRDLRFVRLQAQVGTSGNVRTLRLDHCVRYIQTPDTFQADGKQHVLELVGEIRADTTNARNMFQAYVRNGISAW